MEFFDFNDKDIEPKSGDLLISEPFLADPNFMRTVILLCEHNDQGSIGFILNKPSSMTLEDVVKDFKGVEQEIFIGGPVQQDTLHFIHRKGELIAESTKLAEGLYWGGNFDELSFLLKDKLINSRDFKFFIGYSGWAPGQLINEIEMKSWIISRNVSIEQVFDTDANVLWKEVLKKLGGKYKVMSNYPVDPRLN
jgi:putative transcriptional regulator